MANRLDPNKHVYWEFPENSINWWLYFESLVHDKYDLDDLNVLNYAWNESKGIITVQRLIHSDRTKFRASDTALYREVYVNPLTYVKVKIMEVIRIERYRFNWETAEVERHDSEIVYTVMKLTESGQFIRRVKGHLLVDVETIDDLHCIVWDVKFPSTHTVWNTKKHWEANLKRRGRLPSWKLMSYAEYREQFK